MLTVYLHMSKTKPHILILLGFACNSQSFPTKVTVLDFVDPLHPAAPAMSPPLRSVFQDANTSGRFGLLKLDECCGGEGSHLADGRSWWHLWLREEMRCDYNRNCKIAACQRCQTPLFHYANRLSSQLLIDLNASQGSFSYVRNLWFVTWMLFLRLQRKIKAGKASKKLLCFKNSLGW